MPVLKTKKAIDGMASGQTLEVIATDPASKGDIPAFLERLGHELVKASEHDGVFFFDKKEREGMKSFLLIISTITILKA